MNKKILKRSLALGALMAFVITGSAWAGENPYIGKIDGRMTYKNCRNDVASSTGSVQYELKKQGKTLSNIIESSDFINNKNEYIATETNIFGSKQVERGKGGAIYWSNVDLTIKNSTFQNNSANEKAGAIDVNQNAVVTLENNEFINNSAKYWGGAIELQKATAKLELAGHNNFEGNSARFGGAIVAYNGKVNLNLKGNNIQTKTTFKGNVAYDDKQYGGGAILLTGSNSELNVYSDVEFDGNSTSYNGGAISNSGTIKFITGTAIFKENKADGDGGAIYNSGTIDFDGGTVEFDSNGVTKSGKNGGAIFNKNKLNFKSGIVTFSNNKANGELNDIHNTGNIKINEGAIVNLDGGITGSGTTNIEGGTLNGELTSYKSGSSMYANKVTISDGGTWNLQGDSVVHSIVVNGDATINGAKADGSKSSLTLDRELTKIDEHAINHTSGVLTINNVILENINKDNGEDGNGSQGSVIYSRGNGTVLNLLNGIVQNNTNDGELKKRNAVIRVDGDMTVDNVKFLNNKALGVDGDTTAMGGAFYISTAGAKISEDTITNSTFTGNESAEGGAVFVNKAIVNFENSDFNENHARVNGGALNVQYTGAVVSLDGEYDFKGNTAGKNGGAIAVYGNHSEGKYGLLTIDGKANFTGNEATGQGGAIHNEGIMNVNGIATFTDNIANGIANDIYNAGIININQGARVNLDGGITGSGTTNINGGNLVLKGGTTYIETFDGDGGIIRFESADAKLEVNTNNNETLKFTATSDVNSAVDGDANKLIYNVDWAKDTTMVMEASDIVGEITAELGEGADGKLIVKSKTEAPNPANQALSDAGISLKLHWRSHMNDMNKRMGELRNANGEHGVWTRMVRGESEYENTKAQYNQYQLGYDEKLSVDKRWTVGAAVTFAEGDANYGYGSTEDKSTAFAIYGSKLNNDGTFVDLIARYAHLESDIEDKAGKGDYSTNGMSVSAEFGKRIQQGNGLWIEPQFELTYGNFDSAEFQIGGKTVQVGDMDSLIGRIGFSLGKDIKQGNVYARASYLYDFDGETVNAFSNGNQTRYFKEDLGGGWWEVGVGANINLSKATYIYADVEKTFGGEVDTNWQWNLGVRYSF